MRVPFGISSAVNCARPVANASPSTLGTECPTTWVREGAFVLFCRSSVAGVVGALVAMFLTSFSFHSFLGSSKAWGSEFVRPALGANYSRAGEPCSESFSAAKRTASKIFT